MSVLCLFAAACSGDPGGDSTAAQSAGIGSDALRRVVIGRMYQTGTWALPNANDYRPDLYPTLQERRVAYVCDALAYLKPTYVSGLVRLAHDEVVSAQMAAVFDGVKKCVRGRMPPGHHVKFDVVLNALHYTDPEYGVHKAKQGADRIRERMKTATQALDPDGWFFDFYSVPFNDDEHEHHPDALRAGIEWAHENPSHDRQFIAGNIWGHKIPEGTDLISLTSKGGMKAVEELMPKLLGQGVPVLMHLRNDPQVAKSEGLLWVKKCLDYRKSLLKEHVARQDLGYTYMFPVFFPLDDDGGGECDPGVVSGAKHAYDAVQDGNMLQRMCDYMGGSKQKCGASPAPKAKVALDPGDDGPAYAQRVAVHRAFHPGSQQHLYSTSLDEIEQAQGLTLEAESFFYLADAPVDGAQAFHRCYLGKGWHLLTTATACEGAAGAIDEGVLGFISPTEQPGTVPLHRLFRGAALDHFYTTSAEERDYAVSLGYVAEGVVGHVWTEP